MSTIVVGVDGSEAGVNALRFALAEAKIRGAELKVVSAWRVPPAAYETGWAPVPLDISDFEQTGHHAVEASLDQANAKDSGISLTTIVRQGQPAEVLVAEARGAELLVVGSRGLGGFRGLLLGSVSQQCSHHAPCPVVIVPHLDKPD